MAEGAIFKLVQVSNCNRLPPTASLRAITGISPRTLEHAQFDNLIHLRHLFGSQPNNHTMLHLNEMASQTSNTVTFRRNCWRLSSRLCKESQGRLSKELDGINGLTSPATSGMLCVCLNHIKLWLCSALIIKFSSA